MGMTHWRAYILAFSIWLALLLVFRGIVPLVH